MLEIGAGTGQLTGALLERGHKVVALEVEPRLVTHLERRFPRHPSLRIIQGDARDIDLRSFMPPNARFSVAGNLPYFAANPIIRHLLEGTLKPAELVVMVQREVAREITAPEGGFSVLTISVRVYAEAEHLFDVPPEAFDPPPSVYSSVIRLTLRDEPLVSPERLGAFFALVSKTFRNPRKQIHNSLAQGTWVPKGGANEALAVAGIDPMRRAETLTIPEWLTLLDACESILASA